MSNVNNTDTGGQSGYNIPPGGQSGVGDVYVAQVVDTSIRLNDPLPYPQGRGANELFSPTTHGPNGNCWEVVTDSYNGYTTVGSTVQQIAFYNFCDGSGAYEGALPSSSFGNYVTTFSNGNGMPEYVSETTLLSDNAFHVLLYNYVNNQWDDYGASAPGARASYNGGQGWSMMETHYDIGPCSNVAGATGVSGLRLHFSTTPHQNWQLANAGNTSQFGHGDCFQPDQNLSPWYSLQFLNNDWGWQSITNISSTNF